MKENQFIVGIDLGREYSIIAYCDLTNGTPEIIDISGGYGKPYVPTAARYIPETDEWLFGEHAVLNVGIGQVFNGIAALEKYRLVEMFVEYLVGHCKHVNPNAEVVEVVRTVSNDGLVNEASINNAVKQLFTKFYCEETGTKARKIPQEIKEQLVAFAYQNRDLLFAGVQGVRLCYNFAYPPFQRVVTAAEVEMFIKPFRRKLMKRFKKVQKAGIVLCVGGGFEMPWAKQLAKEYFGEKAVFFNNPRGVAAMEACLQVAKRRKAECDFVEIAGVGRFIISQPKEGAPYRLEVAELSAEQKGVAGKHFNDDRGNRKWGIWALIWERLTRWR